jgi:hypothetical protein
MDLSLTTDSTIFFVVTTSACLLLFSEVMEGSLAGFLVKSFLFTDDYPSFGV